MMKKTSLFLKQAQEDGFKEWLIGVRRTLHMHPEPAFKEFETNSIITQELKGLGVDFKNHVAGTGVIAEISRGKGPCMAIRADMDGLPMEEKTGLPFASKNHGYMHACGHDGHMTMVLGAMRLLKRSNIQGTVRFIFQPGEEKGGGARAMIEAGALKGCQMIFGGHIDRHFPPGTISCQEGLISAHTDEFSIELKGKGGHAARPHETVDCIVVASLLVMGIQTMVSREIDPLYPTVVTVGSIRGGTAPNCIAESAVLKGTVRTTEESLRNRVLKGLKRLVQATSELYGAEAKIQWLDSYPPVINHIAGVEIAKEAASRVVGAQNVLPQRHPSLGGEDFAFYLKAIPGCFCRLGAVKKGIEGVPSHSPRFDFSESVLPIGAAFFAETARLALERLSTG